MIIKVVDYEKFRQTFVFGSDICKLLLAVSSRTMVKELDTILKGNVTILVDEANLLLMIRWRCSKVDMMLKLI
jgi:hypothetical protein